jgi:hypothetical protein
VKLSELKSKLNEGIDPQADAKLNYEKDVIGQLSSLISQAIQMGVVDPNINTAAPVNTAPVNAAPVNAAPAGETPEQKRIRLQKAVQQNIDKTATPVASAATPQTPNQIRQQRQTQATQSARTGMTAKPATPLTPEQIRQQRQAQATQAARTGMTTRENKRIKRLNSLFENIININEANAPMSISDFVQSKIGPITRSNMFTTSPYKEEVQKIADAIQSSYAQDKGQVGIQALADYTWSSLTTRRKPGNRTGATSMPNTAGSTATTSTTAAPVAPTAAPVAAPTAAPTEDPIAQQQSKVGVRQINKIIPTLRKRDLLSVKKNVDNTLAGRGSSTTAAPVAAPAAAPVATPPPANNTIRMPKGKVRAAREGGVTPEEQAKFDEKVRQAMAAQSK